MNRFWRIISFCCGKFLEWLLLFPEKCERATRESNNAIFYFKGSRFLSALNVVVVFIYCFFLFPIIFRVRFFFKYPKTWLNATFPLALLCQHCCWKCRHFQALFGLNDIGRQQSDQTICFSSGWLCNCSFSTVSHSKSAERKNITRNANAVQVAPSPLMSWFKFLSFLSGIVKCVTKSLNLSQCLCLLVPLLWSIVRKVPCVNSSSTVLWRLWNRKCQ